jgi:hypothetical protein
MVKGEDASEQPVGVISALSLAEHDSQRCLQQVRRFVMATVPQDQRAAFERALSDGKTALLVSQRIINVPADLAPDLYRTLLDDLDAAAERNDPAGFRVNRFLLVGLCFNPRDLPEEKTRRKRLKASAAASSGGDGEENRELAFFREEEAHFSKVAEQSYMTPRVLGGAAKTDMERIPQSYCVMLISRAALENALSRVTKLRDNYARRWARKLQQIGYRGAAE